MTLNKNFKLKILGMVVLVLLVAVQCGKKGPLVLPPELAAQKVNNLQVTQVGQSIRLHWDFPSRLSGNTQDKELLQMTMEDIRQVIVYYSNKEIPGDKFLKKADVLRKFTFAELTPLPSKGQNTGQENYSFTVTLPFTLKNLENKQHFFALQYEYRRIKSPLSDIAYLASIVPIKAVAGLVVKQDKKVISLTWTRPDKDLAEKPAPRIAGYNVFRKIEGAETDLQLTPPTKNPATKKNTQDPKPLPGGFIKLNNDKILMEYYEDTDTGTNGRYYYYVSAIIANQIETAPSEEVSIQVKDTSPPEVPANLVCFKAADHIFLTWQVVADTDFSHFRVYRALTPESEFSLIADNVPSNQYKDMSVTRGKTFYYVVTAVDKKGNESPYSNMSEEQF